MFGHFNTVDTQLTIVMVASKRLACWELMCHDFEVGSNSLVDKLPFCKPQPAAELNILKNYPRHFPFPVGPAPLHVELPLCSRFFFATTSVFAVAMLRVTLVF